MLRLLVVLLVSIAVWADEPHPTLALGSPAPDFSLPGIDGKTHTLRDYAASKVLVLVFTCNHCPTAQLYETRIKKLADDYRGKEVALVAIQPNNPSAIRLDELGYTDVSDSLDEMKIRAAYRHFDFPYLYDGETQSVSRAYGPKATPHVFVFDQDRKLRYEGRVDNSQRESLVKTRETRSAIDALLAGQPVTVSHTGVFGCSTKWISKEATRLEEKKRIEAEPVSLDPASLEELKKLRSNSSGKVLLVIIWAPSSKPSLGLLPDLETTYRMYRLRDFDLVTVAPHQPDPQPAVLQVLQAQHASGRNLFSSSDDPAGLPLVFDPSAAPDLPCTLLISSEGKLLYRQNGPLDILSLRRIILGNLPDSDYVGHRDYWAAK